MLRRDAHEHAAPAMPRFAARRRSVLSLFWTRLQLRSPRPFQPCHRTSSTKLQRTIESGWKKWGLPQHCLQKLSPLVQWSVPSTLVLRPRPCPCQTSDAPKRCSILSGLTCDHGQAAAAAAEGGGDRSRSPEVNGGGGGGGGGFSLRVSFPLPGQRLKRYTAFASAAAHRCTTGARAAARALLLPRENCILEIRASVMCVFVCWLCVCVWVLR